MRGFQRFLIFLVTIGSWGQVYSRPTKEEKAQRRASYWGLFADVYRASLCIDFSPRDSDCLNRALRDATSHVAGVDMVLTADEREFSRNLEEIRGLVSGGDLALASEKLHDTQNKLIIEFASNTAPVVQPSFDLGARTYKEYCASCHGMGVGVEGALAKNLRVKPASFFSPNRIASQSPFGIYSVMIHGVDNSEMSSMLDVLSVDELWSVAFYIMSLPYKSIDPDVVAMISARIKPIGQEFALSTLAVSTDSQIAPRLARSGINCGKCENEITFLRVKWPWSGTTGRLGEVAETPRQKAEARALILLFLAIVAVSGVFYFVLRGTGRVE